MTGYEILTSTPTRTGHIGSAEKSFAEMARKSFAAYRHSAVRFFNRKTPRNQGPDNARARLTEEVNAVMNINQIASRHADFGMPAFGRVRMASLRTVPVTTGVAVAPVSGQKCALVDVTPAAGYSRVATDVAVITDAFPGTSAWSPPN